MERLAFGRVEYIYVNARHSRHVRRHPQTPRPGQDEPLGCDV